MTTEEELSDAYKKLDAAENQLSIMKRRETENYKVFDILIVAGFLTQEKINEARDIIRGLDD